MKVGDLVMYNLGPLSDSDGPKEVAVVVADRGIGLDTDIRSFLMFYPHYHDYVIGWEDEYRVHSERR
jgi:hypothetical protein